MVVTQKLFIHGKYVDATSGNVDWNKNLELPNGLPASQLGSEPVEGAAFTDLPQSLLDEKLWSKLEKEFVDWIKAQGDKAAIGE